MLACYKCEVKCTDSLRKSFKRDGLHRSCEDSVVYVFASSCAEAAEFVGSACVSVTRVGVTMIDKVISSDKLDSFVTLSNEESTALMGWLISVSMVTCAPSWLINKLAKHTQHVNDSVALNREQKGS